MSLILINGHRDWISWFSPFLQCESDKFLCSAFARPQRCVFEELHDDVQEDGDDEDDEESVVRFEIYLFPKDTGDISMHI